MVLSDSSFCLFAEVDVVTVLLVDVVAVLLVDVVVMVSVLVHDNSSSSQTLQSAETLAHAVTA